MNKSAREKEAVLNVFASLVRPLTRVAFEYGISASEISGAVRRTYIQSLEERLMIKEGHDGCANRRRRRADQVRCVCIARSNTCGSAAQPARHRKSRPGNEPADRMAHADGLFRSVRTCARAGSPANARFAAQEFPRTRGSRMSRRGTEALLDEPVAAGSVEVVDNSTVRCLSRAYVPKGADVKRIERMGRFLAVIAANFVHNLLRMAPEPHISNGPSFLMNFYPIAAEISFWRSPASEDRSC